MHDPNKGENHDKRPLLKKGEKGPNNRKRGKRVGNKRGGRVGNKSRIYLDLFFFWKSYFSRGPSLVSTDPYLASKLSRATISRKNPRGSQVGFL